MAREVVKTEKKSLEKKGFSLENFKKAKRLSEDVKDKDLQWIPLSDAFQEITGLVGVPKGGVALFRGYSDTGKSTALLEAFASCQKMGVLPVFIDTENSFNWQHARDVGVEFLEVANDDGEIVNYEGDFIYINNAYLINEYGKKTDKNRNEATIENVASFCHEMLDLQASGDLPKDICFLWDSVGTLDCEKGITSERGNNMWKAGALEAAFMSLLNGRIPGSKKEGQPYTNTFLAVQKVWLDSMGAGVIKHKGGEAFKYAARLIFHFGGIQAASAKRLTATANKREFSFGTITKIDVVKNHVNGVSMKGEIVSTGHGYILATKESIDQYKNENKDYLMNKMKADDSDGEISVEERDIELED